MCACSVYVCVYIEREIHGINHFKWSMEIILGYGCGAEREVNIHFCIKHASIIYFQYRAVF